MTDMKTLARTIIQREAAQKEKARMSVPEDHVTSFYVMCVGQIESANFLHADDLYCRYVFSFGPDWSVLNGVDSGLSQIARKVGASEEECVWNFPIDATFKATNAHGWPRIAISVYAVDSLGRDVVKGYGSLLVPPIPGQYETDVPMYAPLGSSMFNQFASWILGNPPEFFDSKFVNQGQGREVTRVKSTGSVKVSLHVVTRGMAAFGYSTVEDAPRPPGSSSSTHTPAPDRTLTGLATSTASLLG